MNKEATVLLEQARDFLWNMNDYAAFGLAMEIQNFLVAQDEK